jgi:uncharacterized 2Fe-2S/4Fe-4S cluster protein (DUF4445 family)
LAHTIQILPQNLTIAVDSGINLMDALQQAGVRLEADCGGQGTCTTCMVRILEGQVDWQDSDLLSPDMVDDGYVLSCQTEVSSDLTVMIPDSSRPSSVGDYIPDIVPEPDYPIGHNISPLSQKIALEIDRSVLDDAGSDLQCVSRRLSLESKVSWSHSALKSLPGVIHQGFGKATATLVEQDFGRKVIRLESGNTTNRHYGAACDIGTTTIALRLVDLNIGKTIDKSSCYNDQMECGADVISRIIYSQKSGGLQELHDRVLRTVNRLLDGVMSAHGISPNDIVSMVFSGNTTMTHLLLGIDPKYIREEPYYPAVNIVPLLSEKDLGLHINPDAALFFSPCVGSYVGGDITAGVLYTRHHRGRKGVQLFIDIGTNGELVVMGEDWMIGCACSAGPAFEGVGIKCGMRASYGAVEGVEIKDGGEAVDCQVIGGGKPIGICGSGLIELVAELFRSAVITRDGKFDHTKKLARIRSEGNQDAYVIANDEATASGKDIVITEHDVENIMRAKAAIYSACTLLLRNVGLAHSDIQNVYVAGGFGSHLNFENAITIGLFPDIGTDKYEYLGNTSLSGAHLALISKKQRQELLRIAKSMTYIDLSSEPRYMDMYTAALFLPHTDISLFPSSNHLQRS